MPTMDHPVLIIIAGGACLAAVYPLARFFFDDFDTFVEDLNYFKVFGFVGCLAIVFLMVYSLGRRVIGAP